MLNRNELLKQTQEQSLVEWAKALNEARDQVNQNAAAGASGTGSGGATGHKSLPNNTIPPDIEGYIPFEQMTFFILNAAGNTGNFKYQSFNYSTATLSPLVDSGISCEDFYLTERYPNNDGSVLLMYVDMATGDDWRIVHVGPSAEILTTLLINGADVTTYWIDGVESNSQKSGLFFVYETENSSGNYDKHVHYFYDFKHYQYIATDTSFHDFYEYQPIMNNGLFFFKCHINDGIFNGWRLYRLGPDVPGGYIVETDNNSGQYLNYWNPYVYYTRDEAIAYSYDSYNPGFFINTVIQGANAEIRSIKMLRDNAVWNLFTVLDNAIVDLGPTGATIENCELQQVTTAGDLLYLLFVDYTDSAQYTFVLNIEMQTIINAQRFDSNISVSLHDMFKGATVIITNDTNDYDNNFYYGDNVAINIIWPDGDTDRIEYTDGTRYMSGDIAAGGNVVTWFTKPAAGGQIKLNRFQKGNLAPLQISIPGFTEAANDSDYEFDYYWIWDITQKKPVYALSYYDYILDTRTWLPAGVDGVFNIADKLVVPANWQGRGWGGSYGFHVYTQTDEIGTLNWYTLNLSSLKFELQFTDENSNWFEWDWDNLENGFGENQQKIIFHTLLEGADANIVRVIKNTGVVAEDKFNVVDGNRFGFTQAWKFSDSEQFITITDTENLSLKQTFDTDLFGGMWSTDMQVDRLWIVSVSGVWLFSNDTLELIPNNLWLQYNLYNDIWRWHD